MGLFDINETFSSKIQEAILSVCMENYSEGIEVDGLVCVSFRNPSSNCVVKIHKNLNAINEESDEFQDSTVNNSNQSHDVTASDIDNTHLENKNDEQMYFYEENIESDDDQRNHFLVEDGIIPNHKSKQHRFETDYSDVNTNNTRASDTHGFSLGKSFQSGNIEDMVKTEPDEMICDNDHELSQFAQPKTNLKKNNLETIIERFSNQNNPLNMGQNPKQSEEIYQNQQNCNPNYKEASCESAETSGKAGKKYGIPVCIDLSESDPDLFEVQCEIESRLHEEMTRNDSSLKSGWSGQMMDGTNINLFSNGQQETYSDTSMNVSKHSDGVRQNIKSLAQIRKTLKVPVRKQLPQGTNLTQNSASSLEPKKVYCKFCGLGFTNSGNKNRHERSTCGAVKYKCDFCDSLFSRSDSRARHMLYCHGLAIKDRSSHIPPKKSVPVSPDKKFSTFVNSASIVLPNFKSFSENGNKMKPKAEGLGDPSTSRLDSTVTMETNSDLVYS